MNYFYSKKKLARECAVLTYLHIAEKMPQFLVIVHIVDEELLLLIADICDVADEPLLLRGPIYFHSVTDLVWKAPLGIGVVGGDRSAPGLGFGVGVGVVGGDRSAPGPRGVSGGGRRGVISGGGGRRGVISGGSGRRGVGSGGQKFLVHGRVQIAFFAIGSLQAYAFHTYVSCIHRVRPDTHRPSTSHMHPHSPTFIHYTHL